MLCSEAELGLSDDSDGILILEKGPKPGDLLKDVIPESADTLYEVGITPNRPDALGHVGVARDLAAVLKLPFAPPAAPEKPRMAEASVESLLRVDVKEPEACPIYGATVIDDVTIAPSPRWLKFRSAESARSGTWFRRSADLVDQKDKRAELLRQLGGACGSAVVDPSLHATRVAYNKPNCKVKLISLPA